MYAVSDLADFICELDQLKAVKRQITLPCDNYRQENSAEHTWHVALMASMLSEYAAKTIDVTRVIRMILIHDIVEIDAGDMFAFNHQSDHDAQAEKDAEDKKDAGIKPIKADADTKRMGDSIQRKIGGSNDPDRLELQGTQEASNGQTIIQFKDKDDGDMIGVDAQGNIYEDGEKQAYGVDVSTQSDVFGDDQNAQLSYKQKRARETGGIDPYTGEKYPKPARTGKELSRREAKQLIGRNKMKITEDVIRKVIRQEIKSMMKEDEEAFKQPIPATVERFMKKFITSLQGKNLNRKRKLSILGRLVVALKLDPSEVSKYARLVKREL